MVWPTLGSRTAKEQNRTVTFKVDILNIISKIEVICTVNSTKNCNIIFILRNSAI